MKTKFWSKYKSTFQLGNPAKNTSVGPTKFPIKNKQRYYIIYKQAWEPSVAQSTLHSTQNLNIMSYKHSRCSPEFPNQSFRQIGQKVHDQTYKQTDKQRYYFVYLG